MLETKDYIIIVCIILIVFFIIFPYIKQFFQTKKQDENQLTTTENKKQYFRYEEPKIMPVQSNIDRVSKEIEKEITAPEAVQIKETNKVDVTPEFVTKKSVQQGVDFIEGKLYQVDSSNGENLRQFIENHDEFENAYNRIADPMEVFETVEQKIPDLPSQSEIRQNFHDCMKKGTNTLEHCLTASSSILYPGLTKSLCSDYYGIGSPYCTRVEIRQINQQNTSARFGPA